MYNLVATNLSKRFGARKVFSSLEIALQTGDSLAVVGPNGSGKSTLMTVLLGLQRPTRGDIVYSCDGKALSEEDIRTRVGFVSPYLNLYDQLTAEENIKFFATVSNLSLTGKEIDSQLAELGLEGRGMDPVGEYSSGMKQRLKYAVAFLGKPDFLFLDEPSANLDDSGRHAIFAAIELFREDSIIVIATNEKEEYSLASRQCRLGG